MSVEPLIEHSNDIALDTLVANPEYTDSLVGFAVQVLVQATLAERGDLSTLNVQVFPSKLDGQKTLRFNVTANKLPDDSA